MVVKVFGLVFQDELARLAAGAERRTTDPGVKEWTFADGDGWGLAEADSPPYVGADRGRGTESRLVTSAPTGDIAAGLAGWRGFS